MSKRNRLPLGPDVSATGLHPNVISWLKAHGIRTCTQLRERLPGWRDELISRVLELDSVEARARLERDLARLVPASVGSALAGCSFKMPPVLGIRGPARDSPRVAALRARSKERRKKVLAKVKRLRKDDKLPTKVLLNDYCTPVGDQGSLGSCVGWGSTCSREFLAREELAPLFAYLLAKRLDGCPDEVGSFQYYAFLGFAEYGHVREIEFPYTDEPGDLSVEPYLERARAFQIDAFADVLLDPEDMELQPTLMKAILSGRLSDDLGPLPVSTSIAIYSSFNSPSTALYGLATVPVKEAETRLGGHAMCAVGYIDGNDADGLYGQDLILLKNSWGCEWARLSPVAPGYCLCPIQYFQDPDLLWEGLVNIAEPSPAPRPRSWLDLLRVTWDPRALEAPKSVSSF